MTETANTISGRYNALLQDAAAFFDEMTSHNQNVVWVFDWLKQRLIYASPAYEHVWGRPLEKLYSRHEEWRESIHPDDRDRAEAAFRAIAASRQSASHEYRILRPDGTTRWIVDRGFAIRDASGQVLRQVFLQVFLLARR